MTQFGRQRSEHIIAVSLGDAEHWIDWNHDRSGLRDCKQLGKIRCVILPNKGALIPIERTKPSMGKLTGTRHGDAANDLFAFYAEKAHELQDSGQYFMAAIALGFALETAILTYLLVEFGEDNGKGELEIPASVNLSELIKAANEIDVLNAPINVPSHINDESDDTPPKHVAKEVVDKIRLFRNLIHPARALEKRHDPRKFTREQLEELKEMYESVLHSLMYYL